MGVPILYKYSPSPTLKIPHLLPQPLHRPPPPLPEEKAMPPPTKAFLLLYLSIAAITTTTQAATFTFENRCAFTVWPGLLSNSGSPPLPTTGFELPPSSSLSLQLPSSWSGRLWGRTGCSVSPDSGRFLCSTADCGSGTLLCSGAGAKPPATLAEFTLSPSSKDFYDVSLVDGYNLPMAVSPSTPSCIATGCSADLNSACPAELKSGGGDACMSACEAFGKPQYCCSGDYANPNTCRPSVYSAMFKAACPRSYSYAYDDSTSTFTCAGGGDYIITFCPAAAPSQKSSRDPSPAREGAAEAGAVSENDAWLASLATGAATALGNALHGCSLHHIFAMAMATSCILISSSLS